VIPPFIYLQHRVGEFASVPIRPNHGSRELGLLEVILFRVNQREIWSSSDQIPIRGHILEFLW